METIMDVTISARVPGAIKEKRSSLLRERTPPLTAYQCRIAMCSPKDGSQGPANSSRANLNESANLRPGSAKDRPHPEEQGRGRS